MKYYQEVSEEEGKKQSPVLKVKSSALFTKDIFVKEVTPEEVPEKKESLSKREIEKITKQYLDEQGIVNERALIGKIFADGLTKAASL
jgi:hypothetical protein